MKYHPIRKTPDMDEDYSHNRDYIGKHWNRKYIRAIQAILNSTKGKIGRGMSFFKKAFGNDLDEYFKLLEMPEYMIIYRYFFEWLGTNEGIEKAKEVVKNSLEEKSVQRWWSCFTECRDSLPKEEWGTVLSIIHKNNFSENLNGITSPLATTLLSFYTDSRKDIVEKKSDLSVMKSKYDRNPTVIPTRHRQNLLSHV